MRAGTDVPLIGRDEELAAIRERLRRAAAGRREAVLVEGEAGIGKTRLISECLKHAKDCGLTVVYGAGDDTERERSFGLILAALQPSAPELFDRLGPLPSDIGDRPLTIVDSIVSILDDASRTAPIALVLDDLHWADTETLRALRSLVRRAASIPFAFVGACRPAVANEELEALVETVEDEGLHLELEPLDDEAVSTLVAKLTSDTPSPQLRERVPSARGNPFFVIEIVTSGVDDVEKGEIPKDLRRTVLRRAIRLPEETRRLLRIASLLGAMVDADELAIITGLAASNLLGPLDEALKAGVLEDREGSLAFRHDLVREAIYTDIPASVRRKLHREAARALAAAGAPARRVAAHLGAVAEPGDGEAISWLRRAAAEEFQRSPTFSADMLGRVAELMDADDPLLESVQAERVKALAVSGRVSEATILATDVLAKLRDQELAADVRASLSEALFFQGRLAESAELGEDAAAHAPEADRGFLLAKAANARVGCGQLVRAEELADRALAEAESTKDPRALSVALTCRSVLSVLRAEESAVGLAGEAVEAADEDFLGESHRYGARGFLGYALSEADRFDEAVDAFREGIRREEASGVGWGLPIYYVTVGMQYFVRGEWDDAIAEIETARALLDEMRSTALGPLGFGLRANIAVHRNELAVAQTEIESGEAQLSASGPQIGSEWLLHARILLMEAQGDVTGAFSAAQGVCQLAQAMGVHLGFRYFGPTLVRLASALGSLEECRFAVEALESFAETSGVRSAGGVALMCRGLLEADTARLLEAVELLRETPRPLELAMAHEQAGLAVARSSQYEQAAEQFQGAFAIYERLGAQLDVARATDALRAVGGRRKRARPPRPVSGWESLSPTERRVATLVAEGLSNTAVAERLVVSRRTVETHVYHVFQKLGISSRTELAARASRELETPEVQ